MAVKQTAGREALGEFAPKFAELNDDVLFGQVWSREDKLSLRDRSIVTVVVLMAQGLTDSSFQYHLMSAKKNGVTKEEMEKYQVLPKHLEGIVQQLRATKDVEAAIFLYENEDGSFKASMRSSGKVDVAVIMMSYGGGGHIRAAGATIEGNAKEILEGIVKDVEKQLLK